jgi:hypothetical protein
MDERLGTYLKPKEEVLSKKVTSLWYPVRVPYGTKFKGAM